MDLLTKSTTEELLIAMVPHKSTPFHLFSLFLPPQLDPNVCFFLLPRKDASVWSHNSSYRWSSVLGIFRWWWRDARSHNPVGALETD